LSPVFEANEYVWRPVSVVGYDHKEKKYKVVVFNTGQEKIVTRLSLLFFDEDPEKFRQRVNMCKERQAIVEAELRFTDLIDSISADKVSVLSKERRYNFLSKCVRESDKFDPDKVYATFKHLMRVVEEEYVRQMKKCIVLKEMQDPTMHAKFQRLKIPVRLPRRTAPYFGVVRCPKYKFSQYLEEIVKLHWSSDNNLVKMTKAFTSKCLSFLEFRYMNTNK
jgi:dynein heavy chain